MSDVMKRGAFWALAALAAVLAGVVSYFACSAPDALEYSLERHAPGEATVESSDGASPKRNDAYDAPLADYSAPPLSDKPFLSGGIAGLVGVAATFLVIVGAGLLLKRGKARKKAAHG